jgi:hypothetical protein
MSSFAPSGVLTTILPYNNLDASERFYNRLGFTLRQPMAAARRAGHLPPAIQRQGWLPSSDRRGRGLARVGQKPVGLYLYLEDVDALAAEFRDEIIGKTAPEDKPWGMYEFALSYPDETLVRVGWPTRLRRS